MGTWEGGIYKVMFGFLYSFLTFSMFFETLQCWDKHFLATELKITLQNSMLWFEHNPGERGKRYFKGSKIFRLKSVVSLNGSYVFYCLQGPFFCLLHGRFLQKSQGHIYCGNK